MADDKPQVPEGYADGPLGKVYVRGSSAFVRDAATGKLGQVPADKVEEALSSGRFAPVTHEEVFEADREEKLRQLPEVSGVEGGIKAFGEGAARSLIDTATLPVRLAEMAGGGDAGSIPTGGDILSSLGISDEMQRLRTEENLIPSTAGGIAPDLAALAATGGAAPLARRAGQSVAGKIAGVAAREGALGAAAGGAMATEDAWRNNTTVKGDELLRGMGVGAVLSGGLGAAGEVVGKGARYATDKLTGPTGRDFLRNTVNTLRSASQIQAAIAPSWTTGVKRGVADSVANVLEPALRKFGDSSAEIAARADIGALRAAQDAELGALESAAKTAGRDVKELSGVAKEAQSAESRAASQLADYERRFASKAERAALELEKETNSLVRGAEREAKQAQAELARANKLLEREALAMERAAIEVTPAIAKAEAALEKARAADRKATAGGAKGRAVESVDDRVAAWLQKQPKGQRISLADLRDAVGREADDDVLKRLQGDGHINLMRNDNPADVTPRDQSAALNIAGNPRHLVYRQGDIPAKARRSERESLAAVRAQVRAKEAELKAIQETAALTSRARDKARKEAQALVDAAKAKLERAQQTQSDEVAKRRSAFEREQRAAKDAAEFTRRELADKAEAARKAAQESSQSLSERQRALQDSVLGREMLAAKHKRQLGDFSAKRTAQAVSERDNAWRKSFAYNVILGTGRATERYARAGFRPGALMAAYGSLPSPWQDVAEAQREQKATLDDAVLKAAGRLPGRWAPRSGVGDFEAYPSGQFQYPGETRLQAFQARQAEIADLVANPELLMSKIAEGTVAMSHLSAEASADVTVTAMRAAEWLSKFTAGTKQVTDPFRPQDTSVSVSPADINNYERVWNATMFPGTLIDKLATWQLDDETILTAQNVHPELVQEVKDSLATAITLGEMKPTYQQRIQLSGLFGVPTPETSPQLQGALMMYAQMQGQTDQAQPSPPPGRPAGSPTMAQQYKTVSQSTANPGQ